MYKQRKHICNSSNCVISSVEMESLVDNNDSNDFVHDTSKLLKLLESVNNVTDSTTLQSMINLYLKDLLETPYVLMVPLLPASEEGLIQVVNDQVLEKDFRFSVSIEL
ncbi:CLUMA_CG007910, isoform A [Clunio marinus]|uniref:CLUMA_CG007910, isoform A n=1 Tax=Clunio marinus TaxID=568069 RepID=A0A1J1I2G5_9DIPT|nr:CLUMA_CG007910, isoform A [Clunio marinus]